MSGTDLQVAEPPKRGLRARLGAPLKRLGGKSWTGARYGLFAVALIVCVLIGLTLNTGLGRIVDAVLALLVGALLYGLLTVIMRFIAWVFGNMARKFVLAFFGTLLVSFIFLSLVIIPPAALMLVLSLLFIGGLLGGAIGYAVKTGWAKPSSLSFLVLALGATATSGLWWTSPGSEPVYVTVDQAGKTTALSAANPAEQGTYEVETLTYGHGDDANRPEYGAEAALKTERTLDLTSLQEGWGDLRTWYWGFDEKTAPINGRLWLPKGEGQFPLAVIVHGNHQMEDYSEPGYAYLGELLASRGYVVAAIDENFLNISWSGALDNEVPARTYVMMEHIKTISDWSKASGTPLSGKVDLNNIALIGHSRGGNAVALAPSFNKMRNYSENGNIKFDYNFNIKSVVAIAPTDYQEISGRKNSLENVNFLTLGGSLDSDVYSFTGDNLYHRTKFQGGDYQFKSSVYIENANHGQFNTVWGADDLTFPANLILNKQGLMPGEDQRQIAKTYVAAFLDSTLKGKREYLPLFQDARTAAAWLPQAALVTQFEDSTFRAVGTFEEDNDLSTTTVQGGTITAADLAGWKEIRVPYRDTEAKRDNFAAQLQWDKQGSFSLQLPEKAAADWQLAANQVLSFGLARNETETPADVDLTVELTAADGSKASVPLKQFMPLRPLLNAGYTKSGFLDGMIFNSPYETQFQTYQIPLSAFVQANNKLDLNALQQITFRMDPNSKGQLLLDDVGFRNENSL